MIPFFILLGVVVVLGLFVMTKYNGMVTLKNKREQSFADIDVQLKQRFDLVPQLLDTVKGYAKHEKELLENVTKARTSFLGASSVDDKVEANNMLTGALKSLFAVSENYPDLKASQNFMQFQNELSDIENKLAAARRFFNNATTEYNTYIQMFPANVISGMFGFKNLELFEIAADDRDVYEKAPEIKF